jgi:hypothetical protein
MRNVREQCRVIGMASGMDIAEFEEILYDLNEFIQQVEIPTLDGPFAKEEIDVVR